MLAAGGVMARRRRRGAAWRQHLAKAIISSMAAWHSGGQRAKYLPRSASIAGGGVAHLGNQWLARNVAAGLRSNG